MMRKRLSVDVDVLDFADLCWFMRTCVLLWFSSHPIYQSLGSMLRDNKAA